MKSPNPGRQHDAESPMLISSFFESTSYTLNDVKRKRNSVEKKVILFVAFLLAVCFKHILVRIKLRL